MSKLLISIVFISCLAACGGGGKTKHKQVATDLNTAPIASAGTDQNVMVDDVVSVDASESYDTDNDPLTYAWRFTNRPTGSIAELDSTTTISPSFQADMQGVYELILVVSDDHGSSHEDTVTITVEQANVQPIANAGRDQNVQLNAVVWLDGSRSFDDDNQLLSYQWQLVEKPADSITELTNATSVTPHFSVDQVGEYKVALVVNDGTEDSLADVITIVTTKDNTVPIADAGEDQSLIVNSIVYLDGSMSYDADNDAISFAWSIVEQPENSQSELSSLVAKKPTFFATEPGLYTISLVVSDGSTASNADLIEITINTENATPIADAGADQQTKLNEVVNLNGNNSKDSDGDELFYVWSFVSKPENSNAEISDTMQAAPSFTVDMDGEYVAKLTVIDEKGAFSSDTVVISVVSEQVMLTGLVTGALVDAQGEPLSGISLKAGEIDIATDSQGQFSQIVQVLEYDTVLLEIVDEKIPYMSVNSKRITRNENITDYDFNVSLFTQKVPVFKTVGLQVLKCSNWPGRYYSGPENVEVTFTLIEHESVSFNTDYQLSKSFNVNGQAQEFLLPANGKYHISIDGYNISKLVEESYGEHIEYTHNTPKDSINHASVIVCDKR